jgi:hypothetical protein
MFVILRYVTIRAECLFILDFLSHDQSEGALLTEGKLGSNPTEEK